MLGVDALNLVAMISETAAVDSAIAQVLSRERLLTAVNSSDPSVKVAVKNHVSKWRKTVSHKLTQACEKEQIQAEIALYQQTIHLAEDEFYQQVHEIVASITPSSPFYLLAKELIKKEQTNPMFARFFCDRWYQTLSKTIEQQQLMVLQDDIEKLLVDLYQRIETLKMMDSVVEVGNDAQLGKLWDMACVKLTKTSIKTIQLYADFLNKNTELKQIAAKLGRMANQTQNDHIASKLTEEIKVVVEKSDVVVDDIVGIKEGDDLSRLLPSESLFLSDLELEIIFYQHLIDKRLSHYQTQGIDRKLRKVTVQSRASDGELVDKGPFVVCIDASGSMSGFPEMCAKAFAYSLMQIALVEERDCYVVLFSTQQITYELSRQKGLKEVVDFLSYKFHGGTDLDSVLIQSIELMHGDKYKNADLIVLSDFIAPTQPQEITNMVEELKQKQNRFHAVCLSKYGNPALMAMFDHTWSYHPSMLGRLKKSVNN